MSKSDKAPTKRAFTGFPFGEVSEIVGLDETYESYSIRTNRLQYLLINTAGFTKEKAICAILGLSANTETIFENNAHLTFDATEEVAKWARQELNKLRNLEAQTRLVRDNPNKQEKYETPVLHGNAIERSTLSDLAITLLDAVKVPGKELVMLLAELLNVDRQRLSHNDSYNHEFSAAAKIVALNPNIKQNDLAEMVGKNKSTIYRWINDKDFKDRFEREVEMFKQMDAGELSFFEKLNVEQNTRNKK